MNLKKKLISTSRFNKKLVILSTDFLCVCVASLFAIVISEVDLSLMSLGQFLRFLWLPFFCVISFWLLGVYSSVVRYIDFSVIAIIAKAIFIVFVVNFAIEFVYTYILDLFSLGESESLINLRGWIAGLATFSFLIISSRLTAHYYLSDRHSEKNVVIYY